MLGRVTRVIDSARWTWFFVSVSVAWWAMTPAVAVEAAKSPQPLSVELNHIYLILDSRTFQEVRQDPTIQRLFKSFDNMMETSQGTYTHLMWPGLLTYIELFEAVDSRAASSGHGAIALGVLRTGDLDIVQNRLETAVNERVKRETVSGRRPWFDWVGLEGKSRPALTRWVQEYRPEHLEIRGLEPDREGAVSRLSYWNSIRAGEANTSILEDVVGVSVASSLEEIEDLRQVLLACGFEETRTNDVWRWTLGVLEIDAREGNNSGNTIRSVRMKLTRVLPEPINLMVAGTRLLLGTDRTGEWILED